MRTLSLLLLSVTVCIAVTPPDQLKVPAGFKVELLREAGPGEGSWICMTQDDQGRLYLSSQGAVPGGGFGKDEQWGGMWRVKLGKSAQSSVPSAQSPKAGDSGKQSAQSSVLSAQSPRAGDSGNLSTEHGALSTSPWALSTPAEMKWDRVQVPVGDAMGMLWAFDSLYVSGMGPQGRGIYRCKSSKGDGNLDTATLFKAIPGGAGEHGAHAIVLGPDKKLYIVNGNSTGILDGLDPGSPYRHWGEDDLLPRLKDPVATFFDKLKAPYGCVYRTDADGTKWELFAGGFRNPYDLAFNPDGELFTYDSDMEWDRGLPWYRPTRILHVVPGGEYGFREGSAKWPAYFPDSLPAVADIGVGCPTGMKFGTEAKGWPEKYRRALFLHDWTYGRILAVTLHEKGASYTARNDLASYTYPRDAEVDEKGDVEVFLSGKGMPVTDLEFLRDDSMVFTVGGRGTAAALYRVSYLGKGAASANDVPRGRVGVPPAVLGVPPGTSDIANAAPREDPSAKERTSTPDASRETRDAAGGTPTLPARDTVAAADATRSPSANGNAPEAQRKSAGGAASEASATTGSPSAKASAPDGTLEVSPNEARRERKKHEAKIGPPDTTDGLTHNRTAEETRIDAGMLDARDPFYGNALRCVAEGGPWQLFARLVNFDLLYSLRGTNDRELSKVIDGAILLQARITPPEHQSEILAMLSLFPPKMLNDDLKLAKLRVLELSFARQGRPLEERVKAVMEELLAHYPVPPIPANAATPARNPAAGAPVDASAWRLNRELCALLTWLSNPELGALNADLAKAEGAGKPGEPAKAPAPVPSGGKTGAIPGLHSDGGILAVHDAGGVTEISRWSSEERATTTGSHPQDGRTPEGVPETSGGFPAHPPGRMASGGRVPVVFAPSSLDHRLISIVPPGHEAAFAPVGGTFAPTRGTFAPTRGTFAPTGGTIAPTFPSDALLAQAAPAAAKADTLPTEAPPAVAKPLNSQPSPPNAGLGPVPNPGADIFPGRKGAAFHAELGRQVIEKTLALMDAAPSQEEQVWYALCLRWAHGWTPEQRVRYFRWFHEKAARYSGGNSFAKFVEAIRADAASRVPEADRAALADWLRPVAAPAPAAALKPRAFVKAWTLPELEAALDKLKDRQPDLARGKELYTQAQCAQCHLFRDAGGNVGPDLTAVAQRFGRHDILESITDPSKVVSEQYAMVTLTVLDGKGGTAEVSGLVKEESSATITILTDPLAGKTANLYKNVIVKREKAAVSIMPPGLLYTLTAEEVADLLAFLGAK